jgi:uncharacterized protein (DUF362 family)
VLRRYGYVTVTRIQDSSELKETLSRSLETTKTVLVKPNWYSPHRANFTEASSLKLLFEAVDAEFIVIEGHSWDRNNGESMYRVNGELVDWRWIMKNPDWSWILENGRVDEMRRQERWFLENFGFTDLFEEHDVKYINVTEEIWANKTVNAILVKERVENQYQPVQNESIFGFMPRILARYEGSTLISHGKVKGYGSSFPSLTIKNMFGLIPDPLRSIWHGEDDKDLGQSILDITKLYASYFKLYGVCEAYNELSVSDPYGDIKVPWGNYRVVEGNRFLAHGPDLVNLDAVISSIIKVDPKKVSYLTLNENVFNPIDVNAITKAGNEADYWFSI